MNAGVGVVRITARRDERLVVRVLEALPAGLLYSGLDRAQSPFVGGANWVALPVARLAVQALDTQGRTSYAIPIAAPMIGTKRCNRFRFCDLMPSDGTNIGLSAALEVWFGP